MTVSTIASVASGAIQRTLGTNNNKFVSSVKSLVSSGAISDSGRNDVSALSTAVSLQSQVTGLRAASLNIAQASSLLGTAEGGVNNISDILSRLRELATRAGDGSLSAAERKGLDSEFQSLRSEITRVASNTSFNGKALLDGSLTTQDLGLETAEGDVALPNLTADALFGGESLTIQTGDSAGRALEAIEAAQNIVTSARADIGSYDEALEIGAATIESAIQNQEAARSTLSEEDFTFAATQTSQARVQNEASLSLLAQTNRLPANVLQLLAE